MKILFTGATGFIGSTLLAEFWKTGWECVSLVRSGRTAPFGEVVEADFSYPINRITADQIGFPVDYVVHSGADTRVAQSTADPDSFIRNNVLGTYHLLEYCRNFLGRGLNAFFYVSTAEAYGPADKEDQTEDAPHRPLNSYAATKAAGEDLCFAWHRSMGVPVIITNTMNVIGENQPASKFIPTIVRRLLRDELISVHGTPESMGSRRYVYVKDVAAALAILMQRGERGERYNIAGTEEVTNLELVERIAKILGLRPRVEFVPIKHCRPGHDKRYSLDTSKIRGLGWKPTPLDQVLARIVWAL